MNLSTTSVAAFCLALLAGCSSFSRKDPDTTENLTIDYGVQDFKVLANGMVTSLVAAPQLNFFSHPSKAGGDPRVVVYMGDVQNRTGEHIETEVITSSIKTALVQSGKFRLVAGDQGQGEISDQVRFQQGTGRVDPATAKALGRQQGADVVLFGRLDSIEQRKGRSLGSLGRKKEDVYYKFTLECVNIETGEIIWIDEQEVYKRQISGLLG
jgi:hypothetical protein